MSEIFIFKGQTIPAVNVFTDVRFGGESVGDTAEKYLRDHLAACDPRYVSGDYRVICLIPSDNPAARQFLYKVSEPVAFEIERVNPSA